MWSSILTRIMSSSSMVTPLVAVRWPPDSRSGGPACRLPGAVRPNDPLRRRRTHRPPHITRPRTRAPNARPGGHGTRPAGRPVGSGRPRTRAEREGRRDDGSGRRRGGSVASLPVGVALAGRRRRDNRHPVRRRTATSSVRPGPRRRSRGTSGPTWVTVTWTPPGSDGGRPITGYTVTATDLTDPARGHQTCVVGTVTGVTNSTPAYTGPDACTVQALTPGDTYTFTVTATNIGGTSPPSEPSPPFVPSGDSAARLLARRLRRWHLQLRCRRLPRLDGRPGAPATGGGHGPDGRPPGLLGGRLRRRGVRLRGRRLLRLDPGPRHRPGGVPGAGSRAERAHRGHRALRRRGRLLHGGRRRRGVRLRGRHLRRVLPEHRHVPGQRRVGAPRRHRGGLLAGHLGRRRLRLRRRPLLRRPGGDAVTRHLRRAHPLRRGLLDPPGRRGDLRLWRRPLPRRRRGPRPRTTRPPRCSPPGDGGGYWIVTADGAVSAYGTAPDDGGMAGARLNGPIVAAAGF